LWEQLGSPPEFIQLPYGQSLHHVHRGELDLAERLDEDLLHLSLQRNDLGGLVLGHFSSGRTLLFAGKLTASRSHLEQAIALYDPVVHRSLARQAGIHPQVAARGFLAIALFCLGYPDQALLQSSAAIAEARTTAHLPSVAGVLSLGTMLLSLVGNNAAMCEWANQLVALATEQSFPFWRAQGAVFLGSAKAQNGRVAEGLSLLRCGLAAFRATGSANWLPHYMSLLAQACESAGRMEEASTLLDDALQTVERTGERLVVAEVNRRKGQLVMRHGNSEVAVELYRRALNIAKKQDAKLWELRAATSLARLLAAKARRTEASDVLAPVCTWFTEGSSAADLTEAKALLHELA
jgi:predicted ATPase